MIARTLGRISLVALIAGLVVSVGVAASQLAPSGVEGAQQPPSPAPGQAPGGGRGGPQPPKNIQVLKDVPPDQIGLTMQYIAAALGVQCNYCHVQGRNDSDDKETKKIAREMMQMVAKVNATYFDGKPRISCASCHNGRSKPVRTPPLAAEMTVEQAAAAARGRAGRGGPAGPGGGAPGFGGAPGGRGAEPPPPPVPTESVDDIVAKYVQGLGGQTALQSAKTRVMTGTVMTRDLVTSNVTVQEKASGEYRIDIATQPVATIRATNGAAAWAVGGGGGRGGGGAPDAARDLAGFQMQQGLRLADFALPLHIKDRYAALLVNKAYDTIDGKPVVQITGNPYPNVTETLSFDRESGLLVRRAITTGSGGVGFSILNLPEQIDYSDYREVGGIKVPYTVRHSTWNQVTTERLMDVKINAPIADEIFVKPVPK